MIRKHFSYSFLRYNRYEEEVFSKVYTFNLVHSISLKHLPYHPVIGNTIGKVLELIPASLICRKVLELLDGVAREFHGPCFSDLYESLQKRINGWGDRTIHMPVGGKRG